MFDFSDYPADDPLRTSFGRYRDRQVAWQEETKYKYPKWTWWSRHHFWWLIHNCVVHPLIGLIPIKPFFSLHDWTSERLAADHL